ncbi:MAG TPA: hypothetical protein PKJ99_00925 [Thermoanaerobaculales bacterium]|nr:hypothetical protein [Thermoanaerobaculales bacterium]HPA80309.1 hypothetical protein [Thermoanaerobaculales bacterium]HQL29496.1 hypothetical protein [Thermoanaerobaculales bacterium]HQN95139.1 hypothetical protein [Thermoanaerobaculales bacterium]
MDPALEQEGVEEPLDQELLVVRQLLDLLELLQQLPKMCQAPWLMFGLLNVIVRP